MTELELKYDKIFKLILSEFFERFVGSKVIEVERGIMIKEYRVDIFIKGIKRKKSFPKKSWIGFILDNMRKYLIIEAKSVGSVASVEDVMQVLTYKFALSRERKYPLKDITVVLLVSKIPRNFVKRLRDFVSSGINIKGSDGLYIINDLEALEVLLIAIDELDPVVRYNDVLCIFASSDIVSRKAAEQIFKMYPPNTFIYAFTIIYKPEVSYMARAELVPPDRLRLAVDVIGTKRLAEAIGPDKLAEMIEVVGPRNLAKALSPDKLAEMIEVVGPDKLAKYMSPKALVEMIEIVGLEKLAKEIPYEKLVKIILSLLKGLPKDKRKELLKLIEKSFDSKD